jgi:hypothetical protein
MAAPEYSQISDEEFNRSLLGNRSTQSTAEPVREVQAQTPSQEAVKPLKERNQSSVPNAVAPPSRGAQDIDLSGMVNQVTNATTQMQQDMPAPKPADSSQHIMDLVAKHWQIPAAVIGLGATAAVLNHLMKGGDGTRPPPNPGGLKNPVEPSMDVNQQGPKEPYFPEEKPTIQSRSFTPTYSAEDQALMARSEANRIAKEQEAARRAATAPPAPPSEPPAFIRNQPPVATAPVATPVAPERIVQGVKMTEPEYQYYISESRPGASPAEAIKEFNTKNAPATAPTPAPTVAAPAAVAETPASVPTQAEAPPKKEPKAAKAKIDMPSGWGKGMSWLTHQYGVEGAQSFIDQYNKGKPYGTYDEMMKAYTENTMRPKYSDIPKGVRQERGITSRSGTMAVPPPSLRPTDLSQGGSLIRSLTDPLQLKQ